ncbi:MAG TPA: hypothetical protein VN825_05480, partial [Candidatus Acidoferrum sp.]|nr:hypothetical protein [Candidatus Acidoferrum sp.]
TLKKKTQAPDNRACQLLRGTRKGDHNDVRSFTEDGQELLHQVAVPNPCDEKHISRWHAGNFAKNELLRYFAREVL